MRVPGRLVWVDEDAIGLESDGRNSSDACRRDLGGGLHLRFHLRGALPAMSAGLQGARKRLLALHDKLEEDGGSPAQLAHAIDVEIEWFMRKTPPQIAALDHLEQLSPMLTAEQIRAELTKVKQDLVDQGPLELDRSQAAPNPLQLPKSTRLL